MKINDAKTFLFIASIYAAAIDSLSNGTDIKDKIIALSNMAWVISEMLPDQIATALGAMDYKQLGVIAKGMNLNAAAGAENNAKFLSIVYNSKNNIELSKFWEKVAEIMGYIKIDSAESIVDMTNKRKK